MQLRPPRLWLRAPPANPVAEPRVDLVHTVPADRPDPALRALPDRADPAHRAPADLADLAHTARADRADQVNSVDPADLAHTARADRADRANSAGQADQVDSARADRVNLVGRADRAATVHGMEIRNVATSREHPGATDRGPGERVSHQGRPTTDPFRRRAGDGTTVQSTTSVINRHPGGIPDSTNGASTSSVFGFPCKNRLARCLLDPSAEQAPRCH
jgi:hypothetical protein